MRARFPVALVALAAAAVAVRALDAHPIDQPSPVELSPCPELAIVLDFPVYGGEHFRRQTIACVWL